MTNEFSDVLPDYGIAEWWRLGCEVKNRSVALKLKSNLGHTRTLRMGKLLSLVDGRLEEKMDDRGQSSDGLCRPPNHSTLTKDLNRTAQSGQPS